MKRQMKESRIKVLNNFMNKELIISNPNIQKGYGILELSINGMYVRLRVHKTLNANGNNTYNFRVEEPTNSIFDITMFKGLSKVKRVYKRTQLMQIECYTKEFGFVLENIITAIDSDYSIIDDFELYQN